MPVIDAAASAAVAPPDTRGQAIAGASNGSTTTAAGTLTDLPVESDWATRITDLKKQTIQLREDRQRVAKALKCAQRKNKRLKERARCLTEEDMVQILVMKRASRAMDLDAVMPSPPGAASSSSSAASVARSEEADASAPAARSTTERSGNHEEDMEADE